MCYVQKHYSHYSLFIGIVGVLFPITSVRCHYFHYDDVYGFIWFGRQIHLICLQSNTKYQSNENLFQILSKYIYLYTNEMQTEKSI